MTLTYIIPKGDEERKPIEENQSMAALNIVDGLMANLGGQHDSLPACHEWAAEGQKFEIRPTLQKALLGVPMTAIFRSMMPMFYRQHATIHRDWNDITIHDLGSKNGVLVNNKRISKGNGLKMPIRFCWAPYVSPS